MELTIQARPYLDADVQQLVQAVQAEYVIRYGGPDEAQVDPDDFVPPNGLFLVGLLDGVPVTMGGWRVIDAAGADDAAGVDGVAGADGAATAGAVAELKRMYVIDSVRRRGLSRLMLARLEASAAAAGVQRFVLNTGLEQPEAIELYKSSGYTRIAGFGHYACAPAAVFYAKSLVGGTSDADAKTGPDEAAISRG